MNLLRPGGQIITKHALSFCNFLKNDLIIDIGCGYKDTVLFLRNMGFNAIGIDLNIQCKPDIQANAMCLPFHNSCINGIYAECVLSLLPATQLQTILVHWYSVASNNAYLILHDVFAKSDNAKGLNITSLINSLDFSGWKLLYSEDCSHYLKVYAAQLIWYTNNKSCTETFQNFKQSGYALWIAQKTV